MPFIQIPRNGTCLRRKRRKKLKETLKSGKQPSMCAGRILMRPEALNNESVVTILIQEPAHDHCTWGFKWACHLTSDFYCSLLKPIKCLVLQGSFSQIVWLQVLEINEEIELEAFCPLFSSFPSFIVYRTVERLNLAQNTIFVYNTMSTLKHGCGSIRLGVNHGSLNSSLSNTPLLLERQGVHFTIPCARLLISAECSGRIVTYA